MIIGATPDTDKKIVSLAEGLYNTYSLKRVFYSAYTPVGSSKYLPYINPPMLREHRLYQADWLLRYYGFTTLDIFGEEENLSLNMDPKCQWAINNFDKFPVEINKADYETILKVPGIGVRSAIKIVRARRAGKLNFDNLKKMGIVLKRAKYFITCGGKMMDAYVHPDVLQIKLSENKISESCEQLSLLDFMGNDARPICANRPFSGQILPTREDAVKCITGEM